LAAEFKVAIVGSGPAGLSAATHAAKLGVAHVLFERMPHLNDTIFKYQKRKHVMATPAILPLRSDLEFEEESREEVIESWTAGGEADQVNLFAFFDKDALSGETQNGPAELTVVGKFRSGQLFYGRDAVKIIGADKKQ